MPQQTQPVTFDDVRSWFLEVERQHPRVRTPDDGLCHYISGRIDEIRRFVEWDPPIFDVLGDDARQAGIRFANKLCKAREAVEDLDLGRLTKERIGDPMERLEAEIRAFLDANNRGPWSGRGWQHWAKEIDKLARVAWEVSSEKGRWSDDSDGPHCRFVQRGLNAIGISKERSTIRDALRERKRVSEKLGSKSAGKSHKIGD